MPNPVDPEALRRLQQDAEALRVRTAPPAASAAAQHGTAVSGAYRIIAELFGGVLVGLGIGFGADMLLDTAPWGILGGVLLGFALAVYMARRTANRLMAQAAAEQAAGTTGAAAGEADAETRR
jgi:ATP synthase protein I